MKKVIKYVTVGLAVLAGVFALQTKSVQANEYDLVMNDGGEWQGETSYILNDGDKVTVQNYYSKDVNIYLGMDCDMVYHGTLPEEPPIPVKKNELQILTAGEPPMDYGHAGYMVEATEMTVSENKSFVVFVFELFKVDVKDKGGEAYSGKNYIGGKLYKNCEHIKLEPDSKEGYDFGGFYYDKECEKEPVDIEKTIKMDKDYTLYVKWNEKESPKPDPEPEPKHNFKDVKYDSWMGPAIKYVDAHGLMTGTTETEFAPNVPCNREMMIQILYNAEKKPSVEGKKNPFKDVKNGAWYCNAVIWGADMGATKGISEDKFGLGENLTREQVAQFLYNYANICKLDVSFTKDLSSFDDAKDVSGWATKAMTWAFDKEIIKGKTSKTESKTKLDPKGPATRAEVAQMIMNYYTKCVK